VREEVPSPTGEDILFDITLEPLRDTGERWWASRRAMDITEKKQAEAQFLRAQRLESVGRWPAALPRFGTNIWLRF